MRTSSMSRTTARKRGSAKYCCSKRAAWSSLICPNKYDFTSSDRICFFPKRRYTLPGLFPSGEHGQLLAGAVKVNPDVVCVPHIHILRHLAPARVGGPLDQP